MSNVAQEIRDLANRLAKINEGDFDDLKLGNYGSELDLDDEGDGEGFTQKSMFEQLGKVIDSASFILSSVNLIAFSHCLNLVLPTL